MKHLIFRTLGQLTALFATTWLLSSQSALSADPESANQHLIARIRASSVFYDSLKPIGGIPPFEENAELWQVVSGIKENPTRERVVRLEDFLQNHPHSFWAPSVRWNLGRYYEEQGRISLAIDQWKAAWESTRYSEEASAKRIGDASYAFLTRLLLSFGRISDLDPLLQEARDRSFGGGVLQQIVNTTRHQYVKSVTETDVSFRCGSLSLSAMVREFGGSLEKVKGITSLRSPVTGFSLQRLKHIAIENGIEVLAVRIQAGSAIIVPSVVHWKGDHFAAIIESRGSYYKVADPGLGRDKWMSGEDIHAESSGCFLVPAGAKTSDFTVMSDEEASSVFGRGYTEGINNETDACGNGSGGSDPSDGTGDSGTGDVGTGDAFTEGPQMSPPCRSNCTVPDNSGGPEGTCPECQGGSGGSGPPGNSGSGIYPPPFVFPLGMPVWKVSEPYINLWLYDAPLGYTAGYNQQVILGLSYKQRAGELVPTNIFSFGEFWNCSWLSYVMDEQGQARMAGAGGGERIYSTDGFMEYYTHSLMSREVQGEQLSKFVTRYPDGSVDEYGLIRTIAFKNYAFLTKKTTRQGVDLKFYYDTNVDLAQLLYVVDADGRTNSLHYTNTAFPLQVTSVKDPFGREAHLTYNELGLLTNITDVQLLPSSILYDTQGWVTNLHTVYGATRFEHFINFTGSPTEFGTYGYATATENNWSLPTRAIRIVDPESQTNVYMLKQDCSQIFTNYLEFPYGGVDYLTGVDESTFPLFLHASVGDPYVLLDNSGYEHYRNSFHWGPVQAATLPADVRTFSVADFVRARRRHWFHDEGYLRISQIMSMEQAPSPDGVNPGQTTWYGYRYNGFEAQPPPFRPSESSMALIARAYPDPAVGVPSASTTSYTWFDRDEWGRATNVVTTWSAGAGGSVERRTNTYIFAENGLDLLSEIGPNGVTNRSYFYDDMHRPLRVTNASGGVHYNTYDAAGRVTTSRTPAGLTTSYTYFPSGPYTNWVATFVNEEIGRTNSYTYTNNLIWTHTDERGLTITNAWDALGRLRRVDFPDETFITNSYERLDLVRTVDRLGYPTSFAYDDVRRMTSKTNALGFYTLYQYCPCGGLESIRDAEGNYTWYYYDHAGRHIQTVLPGPFVVNYHRNLLGQVTNVTDSAGLNVTNWFNNQGLVYSSSNTFGRIKQIWYDLEDKVTNSLDANGIELEMTYDPAGRLSTRIYPDGGVESFGYSERGLIAHTNQIGMTNFYAYDAAGRKTFETNANWEITEFRYDPSGNLTNLIDGKSQNTFWKYDEYGQVTNKTDHLGTTLFSYGYDANGRLTTRGSAAKGQTLYGYSAVGNLTNIDYAVSPDVAFRYDAVNRLTNMVDAAGTTRYSYDAIGQLLKEDGPWVQDTVNYTYVNRLRTSMGLDQPGASPWMVSYGFDASKRLTSVTSPAGEFGYDYRPEPEILSPGSLVHKLTLPSGGWITNQFDNVGRLLSTSLRDPQDAVLNSHTYIYNPANQRTQQVFTAGNFTEYSYDKIGQLKRIVGREANGTTFRLNERFGYNYDAAGNLAYRTNYSALQTFRLNALNQITNMTRYSGLPIHVVAGTTTSAATNVSVWGTGLSVGNAVRYADNTWARSASNPVDGTNTYTAVAKDAYGRSDTNTVSVFLPVSTSFTYDLNGNLLSDGRRGFEYDDENQLIRVTITNATRSDFVYDGKMRRRERIECTWNGSAWVTNEIVHYIYDGNLVFQERHYSNPQLNALAQLITYTRGKDLSGSLQGAGGIGGLLARSEGLSSVASDARGSSAYYHTDGNGNVTCLINVKGAILAKYIYDPYGNMISASGPLAEANLYRFSSKEWHVQSGLVYYLYRYYEPNLQRWINRDPLGWVTPVVPALEGSIAVEEQSSSLFAFIGNSPLDDIDEDGLMAHRKKRKCMYDKHTKAQGRPKAGSKPGREKPNMRQNKCKCPATGVGLAFAFTLDAACQEIPDHVFPDCDGNCPKGTYPTKKTFLIFEWVECVPGA